MINEKLIAVQTELKAPKNRTNSFGGYKYRSCEDILDAVKPILAKNGLTLTLSDDICMVGDRIYVKATAKVSDGETEVSATAYARESASKKGMDDSQITGTASSYARKYALNGLFLIDDTKDADTDEFQGKEANADRAKTEEVRAQKVDTVKVLAIKASAARVGVPEDKILEKFGVPSLEDLTEEQYLEATKLIAKQEKILEKKKA